MPVSTIPLEGSAPGSLSYASATAPPRPARLGRVTLWVGAVSAVCCAIAIGLFLYWKGRADQVPVRYRSSVPVVAAIPARPVPRVATTQSATTQPSATLNVTDTEALTRIASGKDAGLSGKTVAIDGTVSQIDSSKKGKYFRVEFVGTGKSKGFACTFAPEMFSELKAKFPGADGPGLTGKKIHVIGVVEMLKERPVIQINKVDQVKVDSE